MRPGDDAAMFTTLTDPVVMALKQVVNHLGTETKHQVWLFMFNAIHSCNLGGICRGLPRNVRNC